MALKLMYITNQPEVALLAEKYGVDRIWIDLEQLGKEERQKGVDSVKSHHSMQDVAVLSKVLTTSELMVRIDPCNPKTEEEIEQAIAFGAERIMLPMWKSKADADRFLNAVHGRVATTLLLETKEAVACLDEVMENPYLDEIHIGLNDLHLSYGLKFMFELLTNGVVESLCQKLKAKGIPYGFGGVARIGEGMVPSDYIMMEHYRLGSSMVILSRSFCNVEEMRDLKEVERVLSENVGKLRAFEEKIGQASEEDFRQNRERLEDCIAKIVASMEKAKA